MKITWKTLNNLKKNILKQLIVILKNEDDKIIANSTNIT